MILCAMCGVSIGLMCGCLFNDVSSAVAAAPVFMIPHVLFGGFLTNTDSIPIIFIFIEYTSAFKFAFNALAENEYDDLDLDCDTCPPEAEHCVECDPLEDLNLSENLEESLVALLVLTIGWRIVAFIFLKLLQKRIGS